MSQRTKAQEALGIRLADILTRLNQGETIDIQSLPERYGISLRTAQRDLNRFAPLLQTTGTRYYRLDQNQYGRLNKDEIRRICHFAGLQDLFPEADRRFFQESLRQSIIIKGHQYENIRHRQSDFDLVTHSIEAKQTISFNYTKADGNKSHRTLDPYRLINKSGIWYLIGLENGREKTYCFTQTSQLQTTSKTYVPDVGFVEKIQNTDSISYGNQVSEIIIQISPQAAHYFLRRKLLPNQEIIRCLDNGGLLIACKNVNEIEVIPIVQYWIPHSRIVSPQELQEKIIGKLKNYINNHAEG